MKSVSEQHSHEGAAVLLALMLALACGSEPESNPYGWLEAPSGVVASIPSRNDALVISVSGTQETFLVEATGRISLLAEAATGGELGLLAAGPDRVFIARYGTQVQSIPLDGSGELERVDEHATSDNIRGLATDATHVYWVRETFIPWDEPGGGPVHTLFRRSFDGAPMEEMGSVDAPWGDYWGNLRLDDTHAYFSSNGEISRVPKVGGSVEMVVDLRGMIAAQDTHLQVGPQWLYVGSVLFAANDGPLLRCEKERGNCEPLTEPLERAVPLAVTEDHLYWAHGAIARGLPYPGDRVVVRQPFDGGPAEIVAERQSGIGYLVELDCGPVWTQSADGILATAGCRL